MSAHVLLNLLNELRKTDQKLAEHFISFLATNLINSKIQEHKY